MRKQCITIGCEQIAEFIIPPVHYITYQDESFEIFCRKCASANVRLPVEASMAKRNLNPAGQVVRLGAVFIKEEWDFHGMQF